MKSTPLLLALLLLPLASAAQEGPGAVPWMTDLDAARARATKDSKLILLRQILCDCTEEICPHDDLARRPWYYRDAKVREILDRHFIPVLVHVAPGNADDGLIDPGYLPLEKIDRPLPLRTVFLAPTSHVLHRLDLCPHSSDVAAEADFAVKVHQAGFESDGSMKPKAHLAMKGLHLAHSSNPAAYHERPGPVAQECGCAPPAKDEAKSRRPWAGYRRGVLWHTEVAEAKTLAKARKKWILYYQVVGDLNKTGC